MEGPAGAGRGERRAPKSGGYKTPVSQIPQTMSTWRIREAIGEEKGGKGG